jgi:hypothetical protein
MATSLANVSKQEAVKLAARYKRQIAKIKEKGAAVGENVMVTALTIGAGAGAGYVAAKFPGQWVGVDKEIWLGGGLLLLGLTGLGGAKMSDAMLSMGNGVMAAWAYNMVKTKAV